MKVLVVGLGSMGKRRIRCLRELGFGNEDIAGVDPRADRRAETSELSGVETYEFFDEAAAAFEPDVLIISVPPDAHSTYMLEAAERRLPFFVEASVVDDGMEEVIEKCQRAGIVAAPSSTLYFHPAIRKIAEIIRSGTLGKLSAVHYLSGQYLPDWHTYEHVSEYYVSNPATGGGREIVPFELTWMVDVFGFPGRVAGTFRKTVDIEGAENIDDTYSTILDYGNYFITLTVDVVSRYATRQLLINGDKGQLRWDWDEAAINVYDAASGEWTALTYEMLAAESGYNANIGENMYIDEVKAFLDAVNGEQEFVNTLEKDHKVLKTLYAIEESDRTSQFINLTWR